MKNQIVILLAVLMLSALGMHTIFEQKDPAGKENRENSTATEPSKLPGFSRKSKKGFTIWGIQPGDRVDEVLVGLSSDVQVDATMFPSAQSERKLVLKDRYQRRLSIFAKQSGKEEIVIRVTVFRIDRDFSLEYSGDPLLTGKVSESEVETALGSRAVDGACTVHKDGLTLTFSREGSHGLSVILSSVEEAGVSCSRVPKAPCWS